MANLRRCRVLASSLLLATGLVGAAPPAGAQTVELPPGGFFPVTPARLLDTRTGVGAPAAKVGPGEEVVLQVTGRGGVPTDQVSAVALNIAVTEPAAEGYLTAYPTGGARPLASSTNFAAGQTVSTAGVVKLGAGGKITIFNSSGSSHIVIDVGGWHARYREAGTPFTPVAPVRVFDSRAGQALGPGGSATIDVSQGVAGVEAVSLNVTATEPTASTFLTVHPAGEPLPLAANLNVVPGQTRGNFVSVKVTAGKVKVFNNSGTTHVVVDLLGYWAPSSVSRLVPVTPTRIFDSRLGALDDPPTGRLPGQEAFLMPAMGGASPAPYGEAAAVVLNVAVTDTTTDGWLTVYPVEGDRPYASNLNFRAGETVANLVVVPVNELGHTFFYNSGGPYHAVVDIVGWFDDLGDLEWPVYQREVAGGLSDVVVDPTSTYAFISNTGKNQIEVLRLATGLFEAPIPVGAEPRGVDLTPDGHRLYAATRAGVSEVDTATRAELRRFALPSPGVIEAGQSVAVLANGTALLTTSYATAKTYRVGLTTGVVTPLDAGIDGAWARASGNRSSAAIAGSGWLLHYDALTGSFTGPVSVPGLGWGVDTNTDGSRIIAGGDLYDGALQRIAVLGCGALFGETYGGGVAFTAAGDRAYILDGRGFSVCYGERLNDSLQLFQPGAAGQLAISPDGRFLVGLTLTGVAVGKPLL